MPPKGKPERASPPSATRRAGGGKAPLARKGGTKNRAKAKPRKRKYKRTPAAREAMGLPKGLNVREMLFCHEYSVDLNATQAAIRAGYSPKTAGSQGARLLKNVDIGRYLGDLAKAQASRASISTDSVLREAAALAFARLEDVAEWGPLSIRLRDLSTLSDTARRAVKTIRISPGVAGTTISVSMHDKLGAIDRLMKHLGLIGGDGVTVQLPDLSNMSTDDLKSLLALASPGSAPARLTGGTAK